MKIRKLVLSIALLWASPCLCQEIPLLFWERSFSSALDKAKRFQRPILVVVFSIKDKGSRTLLRELFARPRVFKVLKEMVLLPACPDSHGEGAGLCPFASGVYC